jgi:uncharacterized protein YjiS (DUF1127 family)
MGSNRAFNAEPRASRALVSSAFANVATTDTASSARPTSYQSHQAARAHRAFTLGEIVVAAIQAAGTIARRAHARHRQRRPAQAIYDALHQLEDRDRSFTLGEIVVAAIQATVAIARRAQARHRQRRQAQAIYDALHQLDDRTLRDLGFDRSEIRSVAAEVNEKSSVHPRACATDVAQSSEVSRTKTSPHGHY